MRRTWFLIVAAPLVVWGCGDIIGLDGYTDGDGSVVTDATSDSPNQGDVIGSDVAPKDGGNDVAPSCNQQTSQCVPDLPSGWAFTIYDPDNRTACAAGYGSPTDVEEGIDAGPAACTCGCTTTNPDCHSGKLGIDYGSNSTCDNFSTQMDVADGGCNALTTQFSSSGGNKAAVVPPTPVGGSCTPSGSQTIPPVGYAHVPLVLGPAGERLAKRDGAVTLAARAAMGQPPATVRSLLATSLGLAEPGEPVDMAQLIARFDPDRLPSEPWVLSASE